MKNSAICYINNGDKYLMLHRVKKKNDINEGKWIGVGGKFEKDESPEECIIRETKEETGLDLKRVVLRGIVTYVNPDWETEYMYVFTSDDFSGELIECNEGDLEWIDKKDLFKYNMWEGDKVFLKILLETNKFFSAKFIYDGDELLETIINEY